jgi:hypothetical protein
MSIFFLYGYKVEIAPNQTTGFDYVAHNPAGVVILAGFDLSAKIESDVLERVKKKLREIDSRPLVRARPPKNKDADPIEPPPRNRKAPRSKEAKPRKKREAVFFQ